MKTKSFEGKVAAITGAGSGMGRSLAKLLVARGCEVALSDVDEAGLEETARACRGVRVTKRRVDVARQEDMRAWADAVASDHGRVNLVFNNAGISYGATVQGGEDDDFARIIDVNFWGVVHGTRAFLPHLEASGDGHVVNTSSLFGIIAFPGQASYNASKFAVRGFTEALRIELEITGAPVSATCVHPGGIKTNIARRSKVHPSVAALGVDIDNAGHNMEKMFRLSADDAADIILRGVLKNDRRVLVGGDAKLLDFMQRIVPGHYHGIVARLARRVLASAHKSDAPKPEAAKPEAARPEAAKPEAGKEAASVAAAS